jgi:D-sedoheptulose 7-phosphate isomerase
MQEIVRRAFDEHLEVMANMGALENQIAEAGALCAEALKKNNRIYLCGNGGSAADAQHIAAELIGRFVSDRRALPAVALTTDSSAITAIGNDYGFDDVFSRQVAGLCRDGDVLIAISTSGNSLNVLNAVHCARDCGTRVVGLSGKSGGELRNWCDVSLVVPSEVTARIQEMHILIGHLLCELVESHLGLDAT